MRLIIFDCDGTLIDSQHAIVEAISDAFSSAGLEAPERQQVMSIIGLSLPEAFAELAAGHHRDVQLKLAQLYKDAFTRRRQVQRKEEPLYPGIRDAVDHLGKQSDVALAIATGKSRPGVARLLERESWQDHFVSIQTADMHPSKPHPSMILQAMQETGAEPVDTVMIGDTTFDMEMARAAGVRSIGVAWGYHPVEALQTAGANHIAENPRHVVRDIETAFDVEGQVR